ncbi:MAG: hypothetical protein LBM13_03980 [Candidatus Ancillula sp.]|jgi:hypothetical protein|nr:hypothetical protein [Candidatus Ancillula sp.]
MPRRNSNSQSKNSKINSAVTPIDVGKVFGGRWVETKRGKDYTVSRTFEGESLYTCPGCNNSIQIGQESYTVIQNDHFFGEQAAIDERRHWHPSCWKRFS